MPRSSFKSRRTKRDNRRKKNKRKNNKTKRRRKQYGGHGGLMSRPINHVYIIARAYIQSDNMDHNMFLDELHGINLTGLGIDNVVDYNNYVASGRTRLTHWKNLPGINLNNDQIRKYNEAIGSLIGIEGI